MAAAVPRDPFGLIGTTIAGKYRVERVLGEGGFGVVYAGMHLSLDEPVAIKCLKLDAFPGETQAVDGFLREARVLFSLTHPNIVRMYDVGTVAIPGGNVPYVILELLQGVSLEQEIQKRFRGQAPPFGPVEILTIFEGVLEGLSFAHAKGIAHRDLKPSNVMMVAGEGGRMTTKLLDFGTARVGNKLGAVPGTPAQATGAMGFTPRYASPEQWDPSYGTTGPGSDIFALGLMLAEVCTLTPALPGDSPGEILAQVMNPERTLVVSARRYDLPRDIDTIVNRATRVAPPARFASTKEMLAALRRTLGAGAPMPGVGSAPVMASLATTGPAPMPGLPYGAPPPPAYGPPPGMLQPAVAPGYSPGWVGPRFAPRIPRPTGAGWGYFLIVLLVVVVAMGGCVTCAVIAAAGDDANKTGQGGSTTSPGAGTAAGTAAGDPTATAAEDVPGTAAVLETVTPAAGQSAAALKRDLASHIGDLTACYKKTLRTDPTASGRITFDVTLSDSGGFDHATCLGVVGSQATCACSTDAMKRWSFPSASGKELSFVVNFKPGP